MTECLDTRLLESDWAMQCCVILDARSLFLQAISTLGKRSGARKRAADVSEEQHQANICHSGEESISWERDVLENDGLGHRPVKFVPSN
jgi:hypothetical protein